MTRAILAPVLILTIGAAPAAQQVTRGQDPQPLFRSGVQLVPLSVTVTNRDKQFVKGLKAEDFAVFEDGVPQAVQLFEADAMPLDLILLLDTSSSMLDKMEVVHEAAVGFVRTLRPGDRGAIVSFADGVDVVQELTADRAALEQAVRRTSARGATSLRNALYISLKQFGRAARQDGDLRRQAIAVLSDGEDTSSLVSFEDVLAVAWKTGVGIYTIALQSKHAAARVAASGHRRFFSEAEYSMRKLAQETGAQSFFPLQVAELKGVYGSIADELANQYSLAYTPVNLRADGTFRKIDVRVPTRPEFRLRTRTGYTAETDRPVVTPLDHEQH